MGDKKLTILHFNDVYNIEPQKLEPAGGAARMAHYVKSRADDNPLVLFSGDALSPSLMSIFLKGEQMVPILNGIGVHCAVFGNHDFDFGVDHLEDMIEKTNFPWLISNITDKLNNSPLAEGKVKEIFDWHGVKVGVIGLVEEEWIDTLSTIDPADIIFDDFVEVGNKLAKELKDEGADLVVALTHMRWPNDRKVAEEVDGVDIVLGGHDHDYGVEKVNGKYVIKSGTDFRNLSSITIKWTESGLDVTVDRVDLDSSVKQDPDVKKDVERLNADIDSKMEEHLGSMGVSMDGRFASIRTMETNLGNFITDIILEAVPADVCLMNSGTFRSDRIHSRGEFKLRDLLTILPMVDPMVVMEITGAGIIKALENGVSQFPKLEGRFPQVAGISFLFDPSKPAGHRVEPELVKIQDEYLEMEKTYRLCTKEYIASGKDGYDVFTDCPIVVSSEQCPSISTAVRNHFESVQILLNEKPCRSGHRQSLCSIVRRSMLIHETVQKFLSLSKSHSSSKSSSVTIVIDETDAPNNETDKKTDTANKDHNQNAEKRPGASIGEKGSPKKIAKKMTEAEKLEKLAELEKGEESNKHAGELMKKTAELKKLTESEKLAESEKSTKLKETKQGSEKSMKLTETKQGKDDLQCVGMVMEETTRYCCRRDSVLGDAKAMERVAKITQMFVQPVKTAPKKVSKGTSHAYVRQMSIEDVENEQTHLCPKVEGRIVRADQKKLKEMLAMKAAKGFHTVINEPVPE